MKVIARESLSFILLALAFFIFFLALFGLGTYAHFLPDLARKETIVNNNDTGLILLDDQGNYFFKFYEAKNRKYVKLSQVSDYVKKAAIAVEDKEFYDHRGFSLKAVARSILLNIQKSTLTYGGSTITQQLVKNSLLTAERSLVRKYQELILAREIEARYKKDEILEMYINSVYFGEGAFGIEEASEIYFGKSSKDLNLSESSYLIGLLPSPSKFSPYSGDRKLSKKRQEFVLENMKIEKFITQEDIDRALSSELTFKTNPENLDLIAPHFALMVRDKLIEEYGEEQVIRSGFKVKTTLNRQWQKMAEEILARNIALLHRNGASNGAVVVMDPKTGDIKVMVGSVDWNNESFGKVNMALVPRQPGSAFKPIVYGTAFEERLITSATVLPDVPSTFRIEDCRFNCLYSPRDYDGKFRGNVLVRRALANSLNIPAVHVMKKVGVSRVLSKAKYLGISTLGDESNYGLSLVLGAGEVSLVEMVDVYASFANEGEYQHYKFIDEIIDKKGKHIYLEKDEARRVWSQEVAFLISSILSDVQARAEIFGNALNIPIPAAVKTGTTTSYRDAWTIGYSPSLVIGVWVGNNNNRAMDNVAGSLGAAPIWRELMEAYHSGLPRQNFTPPPRIVQIPLCSSAGKEFFIAGTEPRTNCFVNLTGKKASGSADIKFDKDEFRNRSGENSGKNSKDNDGNDGLELN